MSIKFISENLVLNTRTNCIFKINQTGKEFILTYLNYGLSEQSIQFLTKKFNIDKKIIKNDYFNYIKQLNKHCKINIEQLPFLHHLILEPTNECSAHCIHCFHQSKNKYSWSKKEINNFIKFFKDYGIKSVSITGGEIFSPHYVENAKYLINNLYSNNIDISTISTNGMFLTKELCDWLKNNLNLKKVIFRISLDTIGIKNVVIIRPGYKNFFNEKYWDYLNLLKINVIVTTVISTQSPEEILNIAKFLSTQKYVKSWILKPLVPTKKSSFYDSQWVNIKKIYIKFLNWFKQNQDSVTYNFILGNVITRSLLNDSSYLEEYQLNEHPCKEEQFQKTLKANGKISRCPILPEINENYTVDIKNLNQLNSEIYDDISISDLQCKTCKYVKLCGGGCRVYAISYSGNLYGCDLNSHMMWDWIVNENYFKHTWEDYYIKVKEMLC